MATCEYAVKSCKYDSIGCEMKMERKNMTTHEQDDSLHLHMAIDAVVMLQDRLKYTEDAVVMLQDRLKYTERIVESDRRYKTFALTEYTNKKEGLKLFTSPPFYTRWCGYKMQIKVLAYGCGDGEGTHVSVYACLLQGEYDHRLKWPFTGKVAISLLNQLEDKKHFTKTWPVNNGQVGSQYGKPKFFPHALLKPLLSKLLTGTQYLKDDTLYFRALVEENSVKPWLECK